MLSFDDRLKLLISKGGQSISDEFRRGISKFSNIQYVPSNIKILNIEDIIKFFDPNVDD